MTEIDKIKDRIAKLLRMAADASSPNEAAIAAQRARNLMDKHKIGEMDIDQNYKEEFDTDFVGEFFYAKPIHEDILSVAVAKYNDCQSCIEWTSQRTVNGKRMKGFVFNGYKSDVALAKAMFESLIECVNTLCRAYTKTLASGGSRSTTTAFKYGACKVLCDRLGAMTKECEALTMTRARGPYDDPGATVTSLVIVKNKAVEEEFGEVKYIMAKTVALSDEEKLRAYVKGAEQGRKIEIIKSID